MENLPPSSARARKQRGHAWLDTEYLLAAIVDRIGENTAATVRVMGGKAKTPKSVPRPGAEAPKTVGNRGGRSVAEVKAYLDSLKPLPPMQPPAPVQYEPPEVIGLRIAGDEHGQLTGRNTEVLTETRDNP